MAFDGERPVGAATIASRDKEVNMLAGRNDLAVLWGIQVDDAYKHKGVGQALFDMAVNWSHEQDLVQMKIECQNNNIPDKSNVFSVGLLYVNTAYLVLGCKWDTIPSGIMA